MRNPDLWARLQAYRFDGPGSAPFSVKLARAEGWSAALTTRVVEEYRRFLYLTQISDRQVTPSQIVDTAWHMHLTFTRDYWEDLCPNVIGRPVHHQPCAGAEEMPRYRDQFAATKALYEAEFGAEPPHDIWGMDKSTTARRLLISEAGTTSPAVIAFIPFAICLILLFVEPDYLMLGVTVFAGSMFFVILSKSRRRRRRARRGDRDSPDEDGFLEVFASDNEEHRSTNSGPMPAGGGKGGTTIANKRSQDSEPDRNTGRDAASGGSMFGFFSGGSGGDSGGGCGGCGGD